jgi:phosphatidylinositol-3-phosphatase
MKLNKNVVFYANMILMYLSLAASAQIPGSSHVILVIEENTSFNTTVANMPWLVNQGNINGFANNYTTNSGGSLLDYLWLSSGSCHTDDTNCFPSTLPPNTNPFGCTGESCSGIGVITDDSIFAELDNAQPAITWKIYAESLPFVGFLGDSSADGNYVARHNPAVWYNIIGGDGGNIVPFEDPNVGFAADLANGTLPTYSIIVPNLLHDAHDCPGHAASCTDAERVGPADDWLANNVAPVLDQVFFQPGGDGLLIITFDNGDGDDPGQVYTAVIGPQVIPNTISSTPYMHPNTLRTICDALGIGTVPGTTGCPGAATDPTTGLTDFFP